MLPDFYRLTTGESTASLLRLERAGFADPGSAHACLVRLKRTWERCSGATSSESTHVGSGILPEEPVWYSILNRVLREAPLRDNVLIAVDQFAANLESLTNPFQLFEELPRSLDILGRLACGSPFLTRILLSDPLYLRELSGHRRTAEMKSRDQFAAEATALLQSLTSRRDCLTALRRYQRRELLRIGMCDAFGLLDLRFVTLQLSLLADAMVQCCLNLAESESGCAELPAVIALGKHGGEELNYSSDIDLVLIVRHDSGTVQRLARLLIDGLAENLTSGFLYRVDLRLRPWGEAGPLVSTLSSHIGYLENDAALWEKQALLKARVVAGDFELGDEFLTQSRPRLFSGSAAQVRSGIQLMKERIESRLRKRGKLDAEVKLGIGSIRDVEFLVQSLQLIHGENEPRILSFNTLDSLARLAEFGLISAQWYQQLRAGYIFLRTLEHSLQLLHNQKTHELPADRQQREWLAHRLDYPNADVLMDRFREHQSAVRAIFEECLQGTPLQQQEPVRNRSTAEDFDTPADAAILQSSAERHFRSARLTEMFSELDAGQFAVVRYRTRVNQSTAAMAETWEFVICGREFSGWLGTVCGLLSICRLDIRRGDALTGEGMNRFGDHCVTGKFLACFDVRRVAAFDNPPLHEQAEKLSRLLQQEVSRLGELSRSGHIEQMRTELLTRFCEAMPQPGFGTLPQVQADVELQRLPGSVLTQMRIRGSDTWGFLYELASALSLSRFRVLRAIIDAEGDQVRDTLFVRERSGRPIESPERFQELQLAATLIKQFTHWLPSTSDPQHALERFRELVSRLQPEGNWQDSIQSLQRPNVLPAVARILGISQYLWETFLQSRQPQLMSMLTHPETLSSRISRGALQEELQYVSDAVEGTDALTVLNDFKDRHLFRIDMRHILGHCRPFGMFSEELTELAEVVVSRAAEVCWHQLTAEFGVPVSRDSGAECRWTLAGLGKFGGTELGFASDIELMLVYEHAGETTGSQRISCATFFGHLISRVASGIRAAQDGIFQVDLRMRPFGQAGSGAVEMQDFENYYSHSGPAWPYERQALVKFRCFAGDSEFSQQVMKACHQAVYSGWFDFSSMRAMRERQIRQLVRGGTINSKLSDGGIVDCEYAVQAIQITFGRDLPSLRHPNTLAGLREAGRLSLISPEHRQEAEEAYVCLREVIDCLRMVRGNARDLTIPDCASADWQQLSRRMRTIHDTAITPELIDSHMRHIRQFSHDVEQHCRSIRQR